MAHCHGGGVQKSRGLTTVAYCLEQKGVYHGVNWTGRTYFIRAVQGGKQANLG